MTFFLKKKISTSAHGLDNVKNLRRFLIGLIKIHLEAEIKTKIEKSLVFFFQINFL